MIQWIRHSASMYQRGLYAYLSARKERRDLLLSQRPPRFDKSLDSMIFCSEDDFYASRPKAKAAQDYFLLIGPPGTGKTSCALKKMVETFHADKDAQILLCFPIPTGRLMRYASRWLPLLRQLTLSG